MWKCHPVWIKQPQLHPQQISCTAAWLARCHYFSSASSFGIFRIPFSTIVLVPFKIWRLAINFKNNLYGGGRQDGWARFQSPSQGWRVLRVEALVCFESSAACSRYSCHCGELYVRTEEAVMGEGFREGEVDAGSPSKWSLLSCSEMGLRGSGFVQMKEVSGLDAEIWIATSSTHKRVHVLYEKVNMVLDLLPLDLLKTKISSVFKGNKWR